MTQLLDTPPPQKKIFKADILSPSREDPPTGRAGTFNATSARTGPGRTRNDHRVGRRPRTLGRTVMTSNRHRPPRPRTRLGKDGLRDMKVITTALYESARSGRAGRFEVMTVRPSVRGLLPNRDAILGRLDRFSRWWR